MGGRGSRFGGGGGTGGPPPEVMSTTSLISERERRRDEVDLTLTVLRDVERQYNVILEDVQLAKMKPGRSMSVMAYYDSGGNLAVNDSYFDGAKMNDAYDRCVASKFHPPRGNKSGMEAVVAHEMGHRLTDMAGIRAGFGNWQLDRVANNIVKNAAKSLKLTHGSLREHISGYAKQNNAECVAEAFADVYCNGNRAAAASRAVVTELRKYF